MRAGVAFVVSLIGVAACGGTVPAPEPPPPKPAAEDTILKSASLLRRLAEAADGYRDGVSRFVVASREFPHKVLGVFATRDSAESIAADSSTAAAQYEIFGPYRTAPDSVAMAVHEVDSVVAYLNDGTTRRYDGKSVDALFWGLPAFDKFIAPYLTSVAGAVYAADQREQYRRGRSLLIHSAVKHYRYSF